MAEEKKDELAIRVTIEGKVLRCEIPLTNQHGDEMMAKMVTYGALKLAEEQASIFYMQRAMQRQRIMQPTGIIKPGLA